MTTNRWGETVKHGFICSYGRFRTANGGVERLEGSHLRSLFLPTVSREARRMMDKGYGQNFVRGQLLHYGVTFSEDQISGTGALLMKKVLQAGKCDKVPDHITALREEMHAEWLASLRPEEVSSQPDFAMEKYFLTAGKPDTSKTNTVVGIPLDRYSSHTAGQMRDAANRVPGLHCATGYGSKTQTIFMGWDSEAVQRAATGHAAKEDEDLQEEREEREEMRDTLHNDYLNSLKGRKGPKTYSPVGRYIVDCSEIEENWPDDAKDMTLSIVESSEDGIFEATFDFGILEGVMLIGANDGKLTAYGSKLDREDESESGDDDEDEDTDGTDLGDEDDEEEDEEEDEKDSRPTAKRKPRASSSHSQLRKRPRATPDVPTQWRVQLRCRETGEGCLYPDPSCGAIRFKDKTMAAFLGRVDMPCVSSKVAFSARKTSNTPQGKREEWSDYSDAAYEYARVNRWR